MLYTLLECLAIITFPHEEEEEDKNREEKELSEVLSTKWKEYINILMNSKNLINKILTLDIEQLDKGGYLSFLLAAPQLLSIGNYFIF